MEAAPLYISPYKEALIVLGAAGIVIPLFHRLRLSQALGFILIGVVVGPFGLAALTPHLPWMAMITLSDPDSIEPIGRLGVGLLMFMIGLELSFERLWLMRRLVFGLGSLQVVMCAAVLAAATYLTGQSAISAIVVGLALAMSSTAIVLQTLAEEKRLSTAMGRASFATLLLQDLAVVPVLFGLGALSPAHQAGSPVGLALVVVQALLSVTAIVGLGRLVLRPLFRSVARTRSTELFMAACLLVVIAAGLATAAAGLSMALGALIGGLLLAGTEFRKQVEVTIDPFKGLFVGVFLISVGISLDIRMLAAHPLLVCTTVVGVVLLKLIIVAPLMRGFGLSWADGTNAGLLLAPGGEFGFVIVSAATAQDLLAPDIARVVLFVTALTMAGIPLLSKLGKRIAPRIDRAPKVDPSLLVPVVSDMQPRVIIAGFGRVGQTVASMLEVHNVPFVAIDRDPDRVARERKHGRPVYFGDLTQLELLRRLHLDVARALVVTLDDPAVADELVRGARAERDDLLIIARAREVGHAAQLYRAGVTDAVPETIEASLQLSEAVLVDLGIPMGSVIASIHEKRASVQSEIRAMAPNVKVRPLGRKRLRDRV